MPPVSPFWFLAVHAGQNESGESAKHDRADMFWCSYHDLPAGLAVADPARLAPARAWGLTPTGQNDRTPEVWLTLAAVTDLD